MDNLGDCSQINFNYEIHIFQLNCKTVPEIAFDLFLVRNATLEAFFSEKSSNKSVLI